MNFKKSLSLLLIAGIAIGISASDSNTKKNELEAKIEQSINERNGYILRSFGFGCYTSCAIGTLFACIQCLKFEQEYFEKQGDMYNIINLIATRKDGIIICTLASILGTVATSYYGFEAYQAWKNAKSAKKVLAMIEEQDSLLNAT